MRAVATSFVFLLAAGSFLLLCRDLPVRAGAGDEPHYLIVADSFAHFHGAEIASGYLSGALARSLLPPADLDHTREQAEAARGTFADFHAYGGPHGLYSIHNVGLPLLLAPVRLLGGGMLAAKLALLICSVLLPLLAVRAAGLFVRAGPHRLLAAAALCLATPFLIAATQLYPDLLAGILFAFVLLELCVRRLGLAPPDRVRSALCAAALTLAPWLHLRLMLPTLLCAAGWVLLAEAPRRLTLPRLLWGAAPMASLAALVFYNHYAFGLIGGAYDKSAVEVSPTALMVLFGLQLDQFQGVFPRVPLLLAALPGLALLARRDWPFALLFLLAYGALVAPNAFHPNWYGGGSFGGRFMLAGAVALIVPAALALGLLFERRPRLAAAACLSSLLMQAYGWNRFTFGGLPIYTQSASRYLEDYAAPLGHPAWLPAFYRLDLALHHWPNLAWVLAAVCLLAAGWTRRSLLAYAALAALALGGVAGREEKPIWQVVPPAEVTAYASGHPQGLVHVVHGDPAESPFADLLVRQLAVSGIPACAERLDSSAPCETDPAPTVALVKAAGWHMVSWRGSPHRILSVDFAHSDGAHFLARGWSRQESWGVWSDARSADLTFDLPQPAGGALRLDVEAQAFLPAIDGTLTVPVEVDGHPVAEWFFSNAAPSDRPSRSLWIPPDLTVGKTRLTVTFRLDGAQSPQALGLSSDTRLLGIGLRQAVLVRD